MSEDEDIMSEERAQLVDISVLAAVLNALPSKEITVETDLRQVWGKRIESTQVDENHLHLRLMDDGPEPEPVLSEPIAPSDATVKEPV